MTDEDKISALSSLGEGQKLLEAWDTLRQEVDYSYLRVTSFGPEDESQVYQCAKGDTGMYAREDGVNEVFAGKSRLLLNSNGNIALCCEKNIAILSREIRLLTDRIELAGGLINKNLLTQDDTLVTPGPLFPSSATTEFSGIPFNVIVGLPSPDTIQVAIPFQELFGKTSFLTPSTPRTNPDLWIENILKEF